MRFLTFLLFSAKRYGSSHDWGMLVVFPELRTLFDRYWKHKGILRIPIAEMRFLMF
jgi:hypothetical protein